MRAILVVMMVAGCTHTNRATLAASSLALACDWGQTMSVATTRWAPSDAGRMPRYEANPLLGRHPDASMVNAYFFTAMAANVLTWVLMPKQIKSAVPVAVLAVEYGPVTNNVARAGVCGL